MDARYESEWQYSVYRTALSAGVLLLLDLRLQGIDDQWPEQSREMHERIKHIVRSGRSLIDRWPVAGRWMRGQSPAPGFIYSPHPSHLSLALYYCKNLPIIITVIKKQLC